MMRRRPFGLLQTSAPFAPTVPPARFDAQNPAPSTAALRAAWADGQDYGIRVGYTQGVSWGIVCGICVSMCLGGLVIGVGSGLGWW